MASQPLYLAKAGIANQSQSFPNNGRFLRLLNTALQTASKKRCELAHGSNPDSITVKEDEAPGREETPTSYLKAEPSDLPLCPGL